MDSDFAALKKAHRAEIRARLAAFSVPDRAAASAAIAARLRELPEWRAAKTIALYAPLPSEPDPGWPEGKAAALPRIEPPEAIALHLVADRDSLFCAHAERGWSLTEPSASAPLADEAEIDLILVPGVAFDRAGRRLGRGGGYYDRLLARLPKRALRIGVFFSVQELAEIGEAPHDRRLDRIVTEREWIVPAAV